MLLSTSDNHTLYTSDNHALYTSDNHALYTSDNQVLYTCLIQADLLHAFWASYIWPLISISYIDLKAN